MAETVRSIFLGGLTAWAANTAVTVGLRRQNGGNAYECTKAGTTAASGGPSGTGASITDNGAVWKYLAAVNYTTLQAWWAGVPTTWTTPQVAELWVGNSDPTGTSSFLDQSTKTISGNSSTNYCEIRPAIGEGFGDRLAGLPGGALWPGTMSGVKFVGTSQGNGGAGVNYFNLNVQYTRLKGIQFKDTYTTSLATIVRADAGNISVERNAFDGSSQAGGADLVDATFNSTGNFRFVQNVLIERATDQLTMTVRAGSSVIFGNTFYAPTTNTSTPCISNDESATDSMNVRNNIFIGWSSAAVQTGSSASTLALGNNVFSASGLLFGSHDLGNNKYSRTAANNFVNTTSDLRLKDGADAIGAGVVDTSVVTDSTDILGTLRPSSWDAGAFETMRFTRAAAVAIATAISAVGAATVTTPAITANATVSVGSISSRGQFTYQAIATGIGVSAVSAVGTAAQSNTASAARSIGTISATGTLAQFNRASALIALGPVRLSSTAAQFDLIQPAVVTIGTVSATGAATQAPRTMVGLATLPAIQAKGFVPYPIRASAAVNVPSIVPVISIFQERRANVLGSLSAIAATGSMAPGLLLNGRPVLQGLQAKGTLAQAPVSIGVATLPAVTVNAQLTLRVLAAGLTRIGPVQSVSALDNFITVRGGAVLPPISATGAVLSPRATYGVGQIGPITVHSKVGQRFIIGDPYDSLFLSQNPDVDSTLTETASTLR